MFILGITAYALAFVLVTCGIFKLVASLLDKDVAALALVSIVICAGIPAVLLVPNVIRATGGMFPNYGDGVREGYITKVSYRGLVFKTYEAQLQVGTGQQAALQAPWDFSIPKGPLADEANKLLGKKVRVTYKQWLLQPYWFGSTDYQTVSFEILSDADSKSPPEK